MDDIKKIILPITQLAVEYKGWLTAKEKRSITEVLLQNSTFSTEKKDFNVDTKLLTALQDKHIEVVVKKIGDKNTDLLNVALELPAKDFEFLLSAIESVVNDGIDKKK